MRGRHQAQVTADAGNTAPDSCTTGILNLDTTDILDWIILYCEKCLVN